MDNIFTPEFIKAQRVLMHPSLPWIVKRREDNLYEIRTGPTIDDWTVGHGMDQLEAICIREAVNSYPAALDTIEAQAATIAALTTQLHELAQWYMSLYNDVLTTVPEYRELCGDWNATEYLYGEACAIAGKTYPENEP